MNKNIQNLKILYGFLNKKGWIILISALGIHAFVFIFFDSDVIFGYQSPKAFVISGISFLIAGVLIWKIGLKKQNK